MFLPESRDPTPAAHQSSKRRLTALLLPMGLVAGVVVVALLLSAIEKVREDVERSEDGHLQVVLALHLYQDVHGRFPPVAVHGADGRPLHSWRVLILPYIEGHALYKDFHLDEPWDSAHNLALLPRMPIVFAVPGRSGAKIPRGHTIRHVFVGKGAAFEGTQGLRIPDDFPDGTAGTILLVDAGRPVPWTKPEDLGYDPEQPLPELQRVFRDGFWACMVDGSRRWVKHDTREATLRALITRNGGDQPGPDWAQ